MRRAVLSIALAFSVKPMLALAAAKFGEPESTFFGKKVCVNGTIKAYRGKPEIIATSPEQLTTK
jgi:hypothetical protein